MIVPYNHKYISYFIYLFNNISTGLFSFELVIFVSVLIFGFYFSVSLSINQIFMCSHWNIVNIYSTLINDENENAIITNFSHSFTPPFSFFFLLMLLIFWWCELIVLKKFLQLAKKWLVVVFFVNFSLNWLVSGLYYILKCLYNNNSFFFVINIHSKWHIWSYNDNNDDIHPFSIYIYLFQINFRTLNSAAFFSQVLTKTKIWWCAWWLN